MDHAVHNASQYLSRHIDAPEQKLTARIKSVIRRRARQLAAKRSRELPSGSMRDMEQLHVGHSEAEQRTYANELFSRLSPTAQSIFDWRALGYPRPFAQAYLLSQSVLLVGSTNLIVGAKRL
jgi:hypothetical protein